MNKLSKTLGNILTVQGVCPHCVEEVILISLTEDYYRCTNCGEDTKQYVNGSIKYLSLDEADKEWLKSQR